MRIRLTLVLFFFISVTATAEPRPPAAAIASAHPAATAAGREILDAGGNAFDAAIAVAAALAVVEPYASGIGGGGFFLLHRARDTRDVVIDARERAPGAARANMYLDQSGRPIPRASLDGPLAAAIPGLPAGLVHLAKNYGVLPLARSLAPAVRLARNGFTVSPRYRHMTEIRRNTLLKWGGAEVFLDGERAPELGYIVRQPDLARTLELLGEKGEAGFYAGETARRLVEGVRAAGGVWTAADLKDYRVVEREPLRATYRGARVVAPPLPSSGGIVLLEMLGMLEHFDLAQLPPADRTHVLIEAMRRAYRDRAVHLGDPDFVAREVPGRLLDPKRLADLARSIDRTRATPSAELTPKAPPAPRSGTDTTHYSIIDAAGNRVAATLSINTPFGSAFVVRGTGVLLNNEMDDFAIAPDTPNTYGLVGREANLIAPGKRPLSSMTPTFVETGDAVVVLGTPGGSRIISMVLLGVLDAVNGPVDAARWAAGARFHHQYLPDRITHEPDAFTAAVAAALQRKGHALNPTADRYGNMQIVAWDRAHRRLQAAADPRGEGAAVVFVPMGKRVPAAAGAR